MISVFFSKIGSLKKIRLVASGELGEDVKS